MVAKYIPKPGVIRVFRTGGGRFGFRRWDRRREEYFGVLDRLAMMPPTLARPLLLCNRFHRWLLRNHLRGRERRHRRWVERASGSNHGGRGRDGLGLVNDIDIFYDQVNDHGRQNDDSPH